MHSLVQQPTQGQILTFDQGFSMLKNHPEPTCVTSLYKQLFLLISEMIYFLLETTDNSIDCIFENLAQYSILILLAAIIKRLHYSVGDFSTCKACELCSTFLGSTSSAVFDWL